MRECPFCREPIHDRAIKCRWCGSSLVSSDQDGAQIVYVVDRGLLKFGKVAAAILAIFTVVGVFLYGVDFKHAVDDMRKLQHDGEALADQVRQQQDKLGTFQAQMKESARQVKATADEARTAASDAHAQVAFIKEESDVATGIIGGMRAAAVAHDQNVEIALATYLRDVLTPDQYSRLSLKLDEARAANATTSDAIHALITADVARAEKFFSSGNLPRHFRWHLHPQANFMNCYWDGQEMVYGLGLANSPGFGPYESGVVYQTLTHSFISLTFEGQSGAVTESLSDVIAVVIRGNGWTIGRVRSAGAPQYIRSLESPGTAYNNPVMGGKDRSPAHMSEYVNTDEDNGGVHINVGIPNKAAFLMSEGGTFRGVNVGAGLGRAKLGKLYIEAIRNLPVNQAMTFVGLRDHLAKTASDLRFTPSEIATIKNAFHAVGV